MTKQKAIQWGDIVSVTNKNSPFQTEVGYVLTSYPESVETTSGDPFGAVDSSRKGRSFHYDYWDINLVNARNSDERANGLSFRNKPLERLVRSPDIGNQYYDTDGKIKTNVNRLSSLPGTISKMNEDLDSLPISGFGSHGDYIEREERQILEFEEEMEKLKLIVQQGNGIVIQSWDEVYDKDIILKKGIDVKDIKPENLQRITEIPFENVLREKLYMDGTLSKVDYYCVNSIEDLNLEKSHCSKDYALKELEKDRNLKGRLRNVKVTYFQKAETSD